MLGRDSCRFEDLSTRQRRALPTAEVRTIIRKDHLSGAVGGMGFGLLGGFALGVGLVLLAHPTESDEQMGYGFLAITTTALGAVGGLVIGGVQGTTTEYWLAAPQDSELSDPLTVPAAPTVPGLPGQHR